MSGVQFRQSPQHLSDIFRCVNDVSMECDLFVKTMYK